MLLMTATLSLIESNLKMVGEAMMLERRSIISQYECAITSFISSVSLNTMY